MRRLTDWLRSYLEFNQFSEAPDILHFWTGVSVIAAALKQKCYIDQIKFRWIPNFYIIIVAPPGIATKSTTIAVGEELIAELKTINIGPDSMTWQTLPKILEESAEMHLMPDGMMHTMCPVTFFSSELLSLLDLDDSKMLTILTDLWDGKRRPWQRATKTVGSNIVPSPYINIIACITPAGLANLPKQTLRGGFASRTIWVEAHTKRKLVPYPADVIPPDWHKKLREDLLHDLEKIACLKGTFSITPDAKVYGEKWYANAYKEYLESESEEEQGMMARRQTQLHKLAMIISAAKNDNLEITESNLKAADLLLTEVQKNALKTFQIVTTSNGMDKAMHIYELLIKNGRILKTDLYHKYLHQMSAKDFNDALDSLNQAGLVRELAIGGRVFIESIKP